MVGLHRPHRQRNSSGRNDWETGTRFGVVHGYNGARLHAPALLDIPLKARGRVR
ncbi:hypothetical protein [Kitasatospora purpeofusca]|uniref:hypothetical protein n=1 Tax=Kitasatospora purpeofusca TaxID=67352 RepID=UPI0036765E03